MRRNVKIVVVGDGAVGKTCLLATYKNDAFPAKYVPTIFENYCEVVTVDGETVNVGLWDTAGQEDYDRLHPLSYPDTDVFIACFSVVGEVSYDNIASRWYPETQVHSPGTPIVLVGTKTDLRKSRTTLKRLEAKGQRPLSNADGERLRKRIGAVSYLECSALNGEGVKQVMENAVRVAVKYNRKIALTPAKPSNGCCIIT